MNAEVVSTSMHRNYLERIILNHLWVKLSLELLVFVFVRVFFYCSSKVVNSKIVPGVSYGTLHRQVESSNNEYAQQTDTLNISTVSSPTIQQHYNYNYDYELVEEEIDKRKEFKFVFNNDK